MEPDSTQQTLEILKQMMGIGSGQPSSSIYESYSGLLSQINKHNVYTWGETETPELGMALMTARDIIARYFESVDQPESFKHAHYNQLEEKYCVDWLLQAINVPKQLGWPINRPTLPSRAYVREMFKLDFDMMAGIDMNLRVMSTSAEALKGLGKATMAFRDEDDVIYRMFLMETKLVFKDQLIPFVYYDKYLTQEGSVVQVFIAPKDCAKEIDGWQLHIHPTTDTIKVGNIKPLTL